MKERSNQELEDLRYRFNGIRYSIRGPSTSGPNQYIPQISSLYTFPKGDMTEDDDYNDSSSSSSSSE